MQLQFIARHGADNAYEISGEIVNGFDLSGFPNDAKFIPNETTLAAGIVGVKRIDGELRVTLIQSGMPYECEPTNGQHNWAESDWIDAANYDPAQCYIVATSAPEGAEYVKRDDGWTVVLPKPELEPEQEEAV
ncbi:hypothetical protein [Vreelandella titanicae]|uniref:hypothetical protein n=1 Tax=Vreelandella titanicae TaxID=664683 RepID=UPI003830DF3E